MMQERNVGIVEARVGLSLLACLLLALGYVVMQRLGSEMPPPHVEVPSDAAPSMAEASPIDPVNDLDRPQVLTAKEGGWMNPPAEAVGDRYADPASVESVDAAGGAADGLRRAAYPFEGGTTR